MPMNMSHCRFENTLSALQECSKALDADDHPRPLETLSEPEQAAAKRLFTLCRELADDYGDDA